MLIRLFILVTLFVSAIAKQKNADELPDLNGYYLMDIPNTDNQYVFNIDYSSSFGQYLVVTTGQSLSWATARLEFINNTAVNLLCDNGVIIPGIISYPTDLPSICWPTYQDFACWNRLLSNITRIHVINM